MTNEEANFIMHAGKKGMKWGVRMKQRNEAIRTARVKSAAVDDELNRSASAAKSLNKYAPGSASARVAEKRADRAADAWLKDPNTAMAAKLTSGEIAAVSILGAAAATAYTAIAIATNK